MVTSTGRLPSPRYSSTAAPPSTVKMGAPSTAAASTSEISGQRGASARMPADRPSQSPTRMPSPAAARPAHAGDARQTRRAAMTANATGRTSCAIQTGTPAAMMVPSSRSSIIRSQAPAASIMDTAAPTPAANTWVARRIRPSGTNVAVASAISLPSRAAIAAPRKPTQSVKCWTNGIEPGMPPATSGRTTISASGSSTIAASARLATACSAPPRTRTIRARTPAAEALSPMRIAGRPPRQRPARKLSRARTARS